MRTAIGMLIWLPSPNSSERMTPTASGNVFPRRIPVPMQSATHRGRYLSKRVILFAGAGPSRVRLLKLLEAGEMCVCQVVAVLELSQSTVSKHLFLLKMAGLVRERQGKKGVHYAPAGSRGSPSART